MFGSKQGDEGEAARILMVREQIEARGIADPRVLNAMETIPRHEFVPQELRPHAHEDRPLPIGHGQTISQPYIVARMTELLDLQGDERVLEIGAGCGYQSAILSCLAREVCALELEPELVALARSRLAALGITKVDLRCGDGFAPWPEGGLFEAILCACAPPDLPGTLVSQLAPGGTLVLPVGAEGGQQTLLRVRRTPEGDLLRSEEGWVRFVPMRDPRSLS